ncbi:hypothetical protein HETIRDRAFT_422684 [Heterobasidion irregulare TC 32-1]|uniref:Uncharacterized protein n=1 Tax=Heterobasidion irregulare (strain TC 32-1) TaxID=747525 RepID=W4JR98_HETIT|nr:uncharacterized protein HETIRDRAFT_422684 [Heterobasidion irregulare TC 32-1]ETW76097.1 hypothetical protein HETIRDRAFT_422684 [Heterobasidion irregulare TC 32-1]
MIEVDSGFAPMIWQQCVGTVTVMRKDCQPLTPEMIEKIGMYHDDLLDNFSDHDFNPRRDITSAGFRGFCEDYEQRMAGTDSKEEDW